MIDNNKDRKRLATCYLCGSQLLFTPKEGMRINVIYVNKIPTYICEDCAKKGKK